MTRRRRLVVIGNGMAGARFVDDLLARGGGDRFDGHGVRRRAAWQLQPHPAVERTRRAPRPRATSSSTRSSWYAAHGVTLHAGVRVEGSTWPATAGRTARRHCRRAYDDAGARDRQPAASCRASTACATETAASREGVFVFRTLDDCDRIAALARTRDGRRHRRGAARTRGGARLLNHGLEVHVVHLMSHVMDAQLDAAAGAILRRQLDADGPAGASRDADDARCSATGASSGVPSRTAATLECDMVVIAAGIRPNVELAARPGCVVNRGIVVGDDLACCAGRAGRLCVGECAEHRGQVYGLVAPLWEQTQVLADRPERHGPRGALRRVAHVHAS